MMARDITDREREASLTTTNPGLDLGSNPEPPGPRYSLSGEGEPDFDLTYFRTAYKRDSKRLYHQILETIIHRDRLQEEMEMKERQVELLIQERDELKDKLVQMVLDDRGRTPATGQNQPIKSTKLPNPPVLTDGEDPKFEDWLARIKDKLQVNADHYPTDQIQRAYVLGRIGGDTARDIAPRLRADSTNPIQTLADLYQHLTDLYEDPNRLFNAKGEFKKLYMKKQDSFHGFYSKFTRLASEAQVSPDELKYELNHKLQFELQKQVLREFRDPSYTLKQFADYCSITDQSMKSIEERQNRTKRNTDKSASKDSAPKPSAQASGPSTPSTRRPSSPKHARQPFTDERKQLYDTGACFYCKATGHKAFECPEKTQRTDLKAIEQATESGSENEDP